MSDPQQPAPHDPASAQPEVLQPPGGEPVARERRGGRRTPLVAAGVVGAAALAAGGAWAWAAFTGTGPQPAEALPASTVAYAAVDLDPSGAQKIEAVRILRQFPALRDRLDLETTDDLRERVVTELTGLAGCDLDYADEVEPWLGERFAVAALDRGEDQPTPVVVLQVSDAAAADEGLARLAGCAEDGTVGWAVDEDGWAVLGASDEVAADVLADAEADPLTADEDYERWTSEVGDPGFAAAWLAPEAGPLMARALESMASVGGGEGEGGWLTYGEGMPDAYDDGASPDAFGGGVDGMQGSLGGPLGLLGGGPFGPGGVPPEVTTALEEFGGMAAALRFEDGAVEVELVGAAPAEDGVQPTDAAGSVVGDLPEGTVAALGLGLEEGWFDAVVAQVATSLEPLLGLSAEELVEQAESFTGLALPEDAETLLGDAVVLSLGEGFTVEGFTGSEDGSDVPVGLTLAGRGQEAEDVLARVRDRVGAGDVLASEVDGDRVVVGPDADYRAALAEGGDLAGSEPFSQVLPDVEGAAAVLYVDLAAGGWLVEAVRGFGEDEVADNLEQLRAVGLVGTVDGDVSRSVLRIQTGD